MKSMDKKNAKIVLVFQLKNEYLKINYLLIYNDLI